MAEPNNVKPIKTKDLKFDPENPRFYRLNDPTEGAVIDEMLDDEGAQDLMQSIGQKGYFQGEPLLVIAAPKDVGGYLVIEGNRRLAATKLLNGEIKPPARRAQSLNDIINAAVEKPPIELPCLIYPAKREILRYLGYRHITGIKEWDSLSKAKYLSQLRTEFYNNLPEVEQMKALARDIGSRKDYVAQLLAALNLYLRAENQKFFGLPIAPKDIEFSYLTTAMNYKKIVTWLGLENREDVAGKGLKDASLKKAFTYMFSKDQKGNTILGESRNLDQLADVVGSDDAVAVLDKTGDLSEAYLFTEGPQLALLKVMEQANERLAIVWRTLPNAKPHTKDHLTAAEHLFDQSKSIRDHLRNKLEE